jgi:hypothetical protein
MLKKTILIALTFILTSLLIAAGIYLRLASTQVAQSNPFVNFETFEKLVAEVKPHRASRLVDLDQFLTMFRSGQDVIILDTRSEMMFAGRHIKGAKHLEFSEFTQANLAAVIPSKDTVILIYCNNNFRDDPQYFPTKMAMPQAELPAGENITMALNIPTYINLYGYGYKNVYELSELVSVTDSRLELGGSLSD